MSRPKILDLFCGAGGAGMGYYRAGFDVYGVDLNPQSDYPFAFARDDALLHLDGLVSGDGMKFIRPDGSDEELGLGDFAAIHASPPCQAYSRGVTSSSSKWNHTKGKDEPALIAAVHARLARIGLPWVIENVMGAREHMPAMYFVLCGSMFGRPIPRHRAIASNVPMVPPVHPNCRGLAKRSSEELGWEYRDMSVTGKGRRAGTSERWSYLLGIHWSVSQHGLAEAIPPAYSQWVGAVLIDHIEKEKTA